MARKVAVVGMGNVGATVAHYLVAGGFTDDLVLIDPREEKVVADAVDFEDAMANLEYHTNIIVGVILELNVTKGGNHHVSVG